MKMTKGRGIFLLLLYVHTASFTEAEQNEHIRIRMVQNRRMRKMTKPLCAFSFVAPSVNNCYKNINNDGIFSPIDDDRPLYEKWRGPPTTTSNTSTTHRRRSRSTITLYSNNFKRSSWEHGESIVGNPYYISPLIQKNKNLQRQLIKTLSGVTNGDHDDDDDDDDDASETRRRADHIYDSHMTSRGKTRVMLKDPLWEQIRIEAKYTIENEPGCGPQLYTHILSQPSLVHAITSIVSHEISTHLIPAVSLQNLFLEMLDVDDINDDFRAISLDIIASAKRSPSIVDDGAALSAVLFNQGLHALVCHRLAHRLWKASPAPRTGLAYYIQSVVSRTYSTDIHPAATFGAGIYLNAGSAGVVIGETAVVADDVVVLQGVTLGGTGKERGDRHPKVAKGAILQQSCSVLGNINIGEGAIVGAKSIVTKPVLPFHRVSGVPARDKGEVQKFTKDEDEDEDDDEEEKQEDLLDLMSDEESGNEEVDGWEALVRKHFDIMWQS